MDWLSPKRFDHSIPHWLKTEPDYFITINAKPRRMNHFCHPLIGTVILDSVKYRNEKQIWFCPVVILMPDHIHLIVSFPDLPSFTKVIGNWKHWLSHQHGVSWQDDFMDHRIRSDESFGEKADYILQNPVRAGLIKKSEDWPYKWIA